MTLSRGYDEAEAVRQELGLLVADTGGGLHQSRQSTVPSLLLSIQTHTKYHQGHKEYKERLS